MRYLAAALSRSGRRGTMLSFDPGLDDEGLPPLTRHWPRFAAGHDQVDRAPRVAAARRGSAPVRRELPAPQTR
jgi:hypothetical protein